MIKRGMKLIFWMYWGADENDIVDELDLKEKIRDLYKMVDEMEPSREKTTLIMRYGLYGKKPMTQKEVAKELHISRSYVSRIEKKAVEKIKRRLKL